MLLRHMPGLLERFFRGRAGGLIPASYKTLGQILQHASPEDGEWASPIDVAGSRLQWDASAANRSGGTGAWVGFLGYLTKVQFAALNLSKTSPILMWSDGASIRTAEGYLVEVIYDSQHLGTTENSNKTLTSLTTYNIPRYKIESWANDRKLLFDHMMLGVQWTNADNMINFVCKWNGVIIVDGIYARPGITGAPTVGLLQARPLRIDNEMRIQGIVGNMLYPRNHCRWETNYNGTINFGSNEEFSYGQNGVDISSGVSVEWLYQWNGTGAPKFYFDHHRVSL